MSIHKPPKKGQNRHSSQNTMLNILFQLITKKEISVFTYVKLHPTKTIKQMTWRTIGVEYLRWTVECYIFSSNKLSVCPQRVGRIKMQPAWHHVLPRASSLQPFHFLGSTLILAVHIMMRKSKWWLLHFKKFVNMKLKLFREKPFTKPHG